MKRAIRQRARGVAGAGAIAAGLMLAAVPSASADGTAYVLSDVQCDVNHNGVLDLTLVNEQQSQPAVFVVADSPTVGSASIAVAASSASAMTFTDLADGTLVVPVSVDGVDASVAVPVACDAPEVAVMAPPVPGQAGGDLLPRTGSKTTRGLLIGSVLVAAGMAASLVSRRRCT
ncbi:MAG: LPXTG cell wall anchor domain-containing protein [Ilumatobacteraceae bacterium]